MVIEIRIYKRFDADLLALCDAGYPITTMLQNALMSYANGTPLFYQIDEIVPFEFGDKKSVHTRFTIPESEVQTCNMLRHIKSRMRNSFCKDVLRNALVQQNLTIYFTDPALYPLHGANLMPRNVGYLPNVIPLSTIKRDREVEFLGIKHTIKAKEGVRIPYYPQAPVQTVPVQTIPVQQPAPVYQQAPAPQPPQPVAPPVAKTPAEPPKKEEKKASSSEVDLMSAFDNL